ncbi:MAG: hypothetical protein J07HQX50_01882 [Haloquadratum sp. J07HQX50]|nr:MAG: hypothetical protein J07HQX50_01882 [Haloquadratum sp. J07HQX50]
MQPTVTMKTVATWVKDLEATAGSCEKTRHLLTSTAGETGVVDLGRGRSRRPSRIRRSDVSSSRLISGRSREMKFACDGTARVLGRAVETMNVVLAVLHEYSLLFGFVFNTLLELAERPL